MKLSTDLYKSFNVNDVTFKVFDKNIILTSESDFNDESKDSESTIEKQTVAQETKIIFAIVIRLKRNGNIERQVKSN